MKTTPEEQIKILFKDIEDLSEKLLYMATKPLNNGENKITHKVEVRDIRSLLKDKLTTLEILEQSKDRFAYWGGGDKWYPSNQN